MASSKRRQVKRRPTVSALAAQLEEHGRILAEHSQRMRRLEDLPKEFEIFRLQQASAFERLREDVTAPLGRLELVFLGLARVVVGLADQAGVEVPLAMRARVTPPELDQEV